MPEQWIPEFCYEEDAEGITSSLPFIPVPVGKTMPELVYVFESRETGTFEPGPEGEEMPVTEMTLHQYCDMAVLKEQLDESTYDVVRNALGLEPLQSAARKGADMTYKIRENAANSNQNTSS